MRVYIRPAAAVCPFYFRFTIVSFGRFLPISVPHSHVRRTGKCNLPFRLIEICSLTRTAHPDAPEPLQPRSKGRTPRQRHVPLFPSPSFSVPLAKCSSVLAGGFDVAPRSAESPNLYLRPLTQASRPCESVLIKNQESWNRKFTQVARKLSSTIKHNPLLFSTLSAYANGKICQLRQRQPIVKFASVPPLPRALRA